MTTYEVWEYGYGHLGRFVYQTSDEKKAVKRYMNRQIVSKKGYSSYKEKLIGEDQEEILICVKDPSLKGTKQNPNYPSVYRLKFNRDKEEWKFEQNLEKEFQRSFEGKEKEVSD